MVWKIGSHLYDCKVFEEQMLNFLPTNFYHYMLYQQLLKMKIKITLKLKGLI